MDSFIQNFPVEIPECFNRIYNMSTPNELHIKLINEIILSEYYFNGLLNNKNIFVETIKILLLEGREEL